jgi:hypothetical protein
VWNAGSGHHQCLCRGIIDEGLSGRPLHPLRPEKNRPQKGEFRLLVAVRLLLRFLAACKALYDIVVVDADDTVLSFHDVSLFLFPIRTRLPVGTGHRTALAFGFITCI